MFNSMAIKYDAPMAVPKAGYNFGLQHPPSREASAIGVYRRGVVGARVHGARF
jgi:hypothetical protein